MALSMVRISAFQAFKNGSLFQSLSAVTQKPHCCSFCSRILKAENDRVIAMTSDESTIVCYHPTEAFPYQHTKPMPRPDPGKPEEGADSMLRMKMKFAKWEKEQHGPSIEELSRMFYTTKHRWYPVGIRRILRGAKNTRRDRPYM